ncbi:unnamed protein product [Albugo candida]|uniref:Glycerophosphocholine acyltransferase 1 n=1 Tax=Albugo candida TaxID=65357 RepID=A0A024GG18_9STRA|nr:unnamed protein product [Albugo candida]|eukprot:CCI45443.1 unnamed protein product [Albugo candida]
MGIFTPSATINYNFVHYVYTCCSVLCLLLYGLTHYTDAVDGFYVILIPFFPCVIWSYLVRRNWLASRQKQTQLKQE